MISYNIDPFFLTPGAIDTSRFYDITFYVSFIMITMIFMKYFSCVTYEAKVCLVSLFMYNVFYRNEPHNAMHSYLLVKEGNKKLFSVMTTLNHICIENSHINIYL